MRHEDIIEVMEKPISRELLSGEIPARFAYTGVDGFPRVVPVGFGWTGSELVFWTATNAPKVAALRANPKVAITIDTSGFPPRVLLVRGTARQETVPGAPEDYIEAGRALIVRDTGEEGYEQWKAGVRSLYKEMVRITVTLEWAKLLDFETTLPRPVEELIREQQATAG